MPFGPFFSEWTGIDESTTSWVIVIPSPPVLLEVIMRFVGLDVHKRIVQAVIVDAQGKRVMRFQVPCTKEGLLGGLLHWLQPTDRVALEATTNSWGVVDLLEPHVQEVVVSNPLRTKAIAQAKIKTDKVDAEVLAQLLRCDYLPRVWQPDKKTREIRHLTSRRAGLVGDRTRIKNRIHAVLHQRLIEVPVKDLFSKQGVAWLQQIALDVLDRSAVDSELRLLQAVEAEIAALDEVLAKVAYEEESAKLLMTLPGVDVGVALSLLAALGDITRFKTADKAASYLGLVPSVHQSAGKCYTGHITKQGRGHTRWMLVQAAQNVANHPGPLGAFFKRIARKKRRNVAIVAVARKLVVIAWHMLTKKEPYRYAIPASTAAKLAKLRTRVTGRRRKGGTPKGAKRPAAYGTGKGTRTVPSLDQIYAREALPARQNPSSGEVRAVQQAGAMSFVASTTKPQQVPRSPRAKDARKEAEIAAPREST